MTKVENSPTFFYAYLLNLLIINFIWARSSFGKITEGKFVDSLGKTLEKFASNNPYPWVKDFLQNSAIPNSSLFGLMTMWGEFLVAVSLALALFYLLIKRESNSLIILLLALGLVGGMFFNIVFWFTAGWTSASTGSLNLLMFLIQLFGLVFTLRLLKI